MSVSAMKQALDLLETSWGNGHEDTLKYWNETAHFLRQAIAEAEDAVAAEREACAKVCLKEAQEAYHKEASYLPQGNLYLLHIAEGAKRCADSIKARGGDK